MTGLLVAFLVMLAYWVAILGGAWLLAYVVRFVPVPEPPKGLLTGAIWIVAVLACLLVLIAALTGNLPRVF